MLPLESSGGFIQWFNWKLNFRYDSCTYDGMWLTVHFYYVGLNSKESIIFPVNFELGIVRMVDKIYQFRSTTRQPFYNRKALLFFFYW